MSGLLPSMDDKQLDALIQAMEQMQALEAEVARLRAENEKLRMTPEETATIQSLSRAGVIGVRKLLARHAETKGERANGV